MTTVKILLRQSVVNEDENGEARTDRHGRYLRIAADYDEIDLDQLTPRARALTEAIAASDLATATVVWVERDIPIRDTMPEERWRVWYSEEQASQPERRPWSAWSKFRADDPSDPHDWLERQAAKIPAGWHVYGASPRERVSEVEDGLTAEQVVASLRHRGMSIKVPTWRGYVSRGQAPQPARRVGTTPLWDPIDIVAWKRPGQGARTDLAEDS